MSIKSISQELKETIQDHADFPKKGIIFRDFLPIFLKPKLFDGMLTAFQDYLQHNVPEFHSIIGLESRGFLIGPPLALRLNVPFIPVRKPGKLPGAVKKKCFSLEYGADAFEIQCDSIKENQKVVIVDDLLATGGSMEASVKLVESLGGVVEHCLVVIELSELKGREHVSVPVFSLTQY